MPTLVNSHAPETMTHSHIGTCADAYVIFRALPCVHNTASQSHVHCRSLTCIPRISYIFTFSDEANESKTKKVKSNLKKKLSFRSLNFMKKKGKKEDGDSSKVEETPEKKEGEETPEKEGDKEETPEKKEEGEEKKEVREQFS